MKPEDAPEMRCGSTHQAEEDEPDDEDEVEAAAADRHRGRSDSAPRGRRRVEVGRSVVTGAVLGASTHPKPKTAS